MTKPHIVMIHGSWHWGGCFQKVADRLAAMGYPVSTPDLLSHGYSAAAWEQVDSMASYTAPVRAILDKIGEPVILVGHSMGGVSLTYLAETMPEKILSLVYLSAFMTPPGKTANDYIFAYATNPVAASLFAVLAPVNEGAGLKLDTDKPDAIRDAFYGDCSDADVLIASKNAVIINTSVPNIYAPKALPAVPKHYIHCTEDHAIPLEVQQQMIADAPGATAHVLKASHSPFFSLPDDVATLIATIAGS